MSKFLKVDATSDPATYLSKDLAGLDEIYVSYTLFLPAAFAAMAVAGPIVSLLSDNTTPGTDTEGVQPDPTGPSFLELLGSSALAGSPTAGSHTVAIHAKISTDTLVVTVDGTPTDLSGGGLFAAQMINQFDELDLGGIDGPGDPGAIYYISDVMVGTTGAGSTDVMDEDFSSGDFFTNWDGVNDGSSLSIVDSVPSLGTPAAVHGPWWDPAGAIRTPIPADAAVHADSDTWVTAMEGNTDVTDALFFPNGTEIVGGDGSTTVYYVTTATPSHVITLDPGLTAGAGPFSGSGTPTVRIPAGAIVTPTDGHILLIWEEDDPALGYVKGDQVGFQGLDIGANAAHSYEIYNVLTDSGGGVSSNRVAMGPLGGGEILKSEVQAVADGLIDHIPHALRFILPNSITGSDFVSPGSGSDGSASPGDGPPGGARMRMKAATDISGLSAWNTMIAKTMKLYGGELYDCGDSAAIACESTLTGSGYAIEPDVLDGSFVSDMEFMAEAPTGGGGDSGGGGGDDGGGGSGGSSGGGSARFPESIIWRLLLVDLVTNPGAVIACLDPIALSRDVTPILNQPDIGSCEVVSDDIRVSNPVSDDDPSPVLQKNTTALVWLRRDGAGTDDSPLYRPRSAGPILQLQDAADTDLSRTTISMFGPDKLWDGVPAVINSDGDRIPKEGYSFTGTDASAIAQALIADSTAARLSSDDPVVARASCFIDWGPDLGGTDFWAGRVQTGLGDTTITFQLYSSLGDCIRQLIATGVLDVVINPIWDPVNRPGYLAEGSIVAQAGGDRPGAVFGWDTPPQSLVKITRLDDGSPGVLINRVDFGVDQGAIVGQVNETSTSVPSVEKYGEMWLLQSWPGQPIVAAVQALADLIVRLAKTGKTIVTLTPAPERAPVPFIAYGLGDTVPVYTSRRFRQPLTGDRVRVMGIEFQLSDDGVEQVGQILTSADGDFSG